MLRFKSLLLIRADVLKRKSSCGTLPYKSHPLLGTDPDMLAIAFDPNAKIGKNKVPSNFTAVDNRFLN
jgi:hypothetical protein